MKIILGKEKSLLYIFCFSRNPMSRHQAHISMWVESSHTAVQEQHTCDDPRTRLQYSEQISKLKMFQILTKDIP